MAKFIISAKSVGYLEKEVEAKNEQAAYDILETLLIDGKMPEVTGYIEGKLVENV